MKIFGREPALVVGVLGAVLVMLASFNISFLNAGQAAAITAMLASLVMAWTTRPAAPALFTGVIAAGAALMAEYGLMLADAQVGAISAAVLAIFALVARQQLHPQETPVSKA